MKRQAVTHFSRAGNIFRTESREDSATGYIFTDLMTDSEAEDPIRSETAVSYLYRKRKTGFPIFYNRIEHSG